MTTTMTNQERFAALNRVTERYDRMGATCLQYQRMRQACYPSPFRTTAGESRFFIVRHKR
jgi:hypothetical protein